MQRDGLRIAVAFQGALLFSLGILGLVLLFAGSRSSEAATVPVPASPDPVQPAAPLANTPGDGIVLEQVGSLGGESVELAVSGDIGLIGDGTGIIVVDVSDPDAPQRRERINFEQLVSGIALSGTLAYVGLWENGLQIVDISTPTQPELRGSVAFDDASASVSDIQLVADTVYAVSSRSIQRIDVSNPDAPVILNTGQGLFGSEDIHVAEDLALVAAGSRGLGIYDVSSLTETQRITTFTAFPFSVGPTGVFHDGTLAYVALGNFYVLDISDPTSPTILSELDRNVIGFAYAIDVVGDLAYVGLDTGGFGVFDVSNPANPQPRGRISRSEGIPGFGRLVQVVDDLAYLSDRFGLRIIDVSDPDNLVLRGSLDTLPSSVSRVQTDGSSVFIASGDELMIFDRNAPANPLARIDGPSFFDPVNGSVLSGTTWYVLGPRNGLSVYDVSDRENPVLQDIYQIGLHLKFDVKGSTALIQTSSPEELFLVDVGEPENLSALGVIDTGMSIGTFDSVGPYAYVTGAISGTRTLRIFDISDPVSPTLVSSYTTGVSDNDMVVRDNLMYLAFFNGMLILDVSDPQSPALIGRYQSFGFDRIELYQNIAVLQGVDSLVLVDISNPTEPVRVGSYELPGGTGNMDVTPAGEIYVARNVAGVQIISPTVLPLTQVTLSVPNGYRLNEVYTFTATVLPINALPPITFTWQATDQAPVVEAGVFTRTSVLTASWSTLGVKTITVTAQNQVGEPVTTTTIVQEMDMETSTPTASPTPTPSATPTASSTPTATVTARPPLSGTVTATPTPTASSIPTATVTARPPLSGTVTATPTPTASSTPTATVTARPPLSGTVTTTPTPTASSIPTATVTARPPLSGTVTTTPTPTNTPTATVPITPSATPTSTPMPNSDLTMTLGCASTVQPGDTLNCTLTYTNTVALALEDVELVLTLPTGTDLDVATRNAGWEAALVVQQTSSYRLILGAVAAETTDMLSVGIVVSDTVSTGTALLVEAEAMSRANSGGGMVVQARSSALTQVILAGERTYLPLVRKD